MGDRTEDGRFKDSAATLDTQARQGIGRAHSREQADLAAHLPDPVSPGPYDRHVPGGGSAGKDFLLLAVVAAVLYGGWAWVYKPINSYWASASAAKARLAEYSALHPSLPGARAAAFEAVGAWWPAVQGNSAFQPDFGKGFDWEKARRGRPFAQILAEHSARPTRLTAALLANALSPPYVKEVAAAGPDAAERTHAEAAALASRLESTIPKSALPVEKLAACRFSAEASLAAALAGGPASLFEKAAAKARSCAESEAFREYKVSGNPVYREMYVEAVEKSAADAEKALAAFRRAGGR
jgi:hypothetical protein